MPLLFGQPAVVSVRGRWAQQGKQQGKRQGEFRERALGKPLLNMQVGRLGVREHYRTTTELPSKSPFGQVRGGVPRQNCDPPLNQSNRTVFGFAWFSVSNWPHAAPAEAFVRTDCPIPLFSPRSTLGESGPAATTCRFEEEASAGSVLRF